MNPGSESYAHLLKFLIVGNAATGKTCLMRMFIDGKFKEDSLHTIGVEFGSKIVQIDGKTVKLQIWDTAGQERFQSVTRSYYRGAAGALVVYDVNDRMSFTAIQKWISSVRDLAQSDITIILVGNKTDLAQESRQVTELEGRQWAEDNDLYAFLETSAKTGTNVNEAFIAAVRGTLSRVPTIRQGALYPARIGPTQLTPPENKTSTRAGCCRTSS